MIHNPLSNVAGNAAEMRSAATTLDTLRDTIVNIYADKTGKSKEDIIKAMDAESWFNAEEAVAFGLADRIAGDDEGDDDDEEDFSNQIDPPLLLATFKNVPAKLALNLAAGARNKRRKGDQENAMLKVINRDGKQFVNIDGKEHELQAAETAVATGKSDAEVTAAIEAAKKEAIKGEQEYRNQFDTITSAAGITGENLGKFHKEFYSLPLNQVKFLADNALASRAKPVGEGSAAAATAQTDEEKQLAQVEAEAGKRFDEEEGVRRSFNVRTNDKNSDQYKSAKGRFVAAAKRRFETATK
jgi:hypothetical protein